VDVHKQRSTWLNTEYYSADSFSSLTFCFVGCLFDGHVVDVELLIGFHFARRGTDGCVGNVRA
jgi:hypothetical protein